jgi:hypothetical protein
MSVVAAASLTKQFNFFQRYPQYKRPNSFKTYSDFMAVVIDTEKANIIDVRSRTRADDCSLIERSLELVSICVHIWGRERGSTKMLPE